MTRKDVFCCLGENDSPWNGNNKASHKKRGAAAAANKDEQNAIIQKGKIWTQFVSSRVLSSVYWAFVERRLPWQQQLSDGSERDWPLSSCPWQTFISVCVCRMLCICPLISQSSNTMLVEKWPEPMTVYSILIAYRLSNTVDVFQQCLLKRMEPDVRPKTDSLPCSGFGAGDSDEIYWFLFAVLDIFVAWVPPSPLICTWKEPFTSTQPEQLDINSAMLAWRSVPQFQSWRPTDPPCVSDVALLPHTWFISSKTWAGSVGLEDRNWETLALSLLEKLKIITFRVRWHWLEASHTVVLHASSEDLLSPGLKVVIVIRTIKAAGLYA